MLDYIESYFKKTHRWLLWLSVIVFSAFGISKAQSQSPVFNETNAWNWLVAQCEIGPRPPGSKAHHTCLEYLETELERFGHAVQRQEFMGRNPLSGESYNLTNLVASFWPSRPRRVLLCAHWDTRPWADQDPNPDNHDTPIIGANDGASGVAVLLEICRCLTLQDPGIGVDVVFFDGEDMGRAGRLDEYCLGSKWYAQMMRYPSPEAVVLLDMIGDADLHIPQELYSRLTAPDLVDEIYDIAEQTGETAFDRSAGHPVYDDHVAFLNQGIPAVNLIDFDYPYWHTIEDKPEKCSGESMGSVGRVVVAWLYQYKDRH
jgi:hypothetical protein